MGVSGSGAQQVIGERSKKQLWRALSPTPWVHESVSTRSGAQGARNLGGAHLGDHPLKANLTPVGGLRLKCPFPKGPGWAPLLWALDF